jgi:hypothetical protein
METSRNPQAMSMAVTSLMERMNMHYPQSFIMMSSARQYHTIMQLFMRVQVAALYPVRAHLHSVLVIDAAATGESANDTQEA